MTFAEFHEAVGELAGGAYFSTKVEITTNSRGRMSVECAAYVDNEWTRDHATPEAVLAELRSAAYDATRDSVAALNEIPSASSEDAAAE